MNKQTLDTTARQWIAGFDSHAREVLAGVYAKGVVLSASGAEAAVDTLVEAARAAVDRVA